MGRRPSLSPGLRCPSGLQRVRAAPPDGYVAGATWWRVRGRPSSDFRSAVDGWSSVEAEAATPLSSRSCAPRACSVQNGEVGGSSNRARANVARKMKEVEHMLENLGKEGVQIDGMIASIIDDEVSRIKAEAARENSNNDLKKNGIMVLMAIACVAFGFFMGVEWAEEALYTELRRESFMDIMDKGSTTKKRKRSARKKVVRRDDDANYDVGLLLKLEAEMEQGTTVEDGNIMADRDCDGTSKPTENATSKGDGMSRMVRKSGEKEEIEPSHEELSKDRDLDKLDTDGDKHVAMPETEKESVDKEEIEPIEEGPVADSDVLADRDVRTQSVNQPIGKLPQVFYGLSGSAVHVYVEEYRKHINLYDLHLLLDLSPSVEPHGHETSRSILLMATVQKILIMRQLEHMAPFGCPATAESRRAPAAGRHRAERETEGGGGEQERVREG
ncbi:uncharacterized protein C2845_PM06G27270 [Panicum miliaceum]|uniref:Uncharacterized protein n=1 Tax=Panicum miliaceum TaxID=4540 RepID=A0A3L6RCC8_PANMI|nr:uncharacterized protein C2845_PM06G27270 [Panicum miliaceum]